MPITSPIKKSSLKQFHSKNRETLPVLEKLIKRALVNKVVSCLEESLIVYIHHPLETSINLIEAIISLGAQPKNIFILGKYYSECPSVVERMIALGVHYQPCSPQIGLGRFAQTFIQDINWLWHKVILHQKKNIKNILILDHGGYALSFVPSVITNNYKVIGIEKTSAGLINFEKYGIPSFPLINLANCAAKKILESPLIADAVIKKLGSIMTNENKNLICGVIGYGAIGRAVAKKLNEMGYKVLVYDQDYDVIESIKEKKQEVKFNLIEIIDSSDYIFGCTGRDVTKSIDFYQLQNKDKTFISCSSGDKEFLSLLRIIQRESEISYKPFEDIFYKTKSMSVFHILKGGFPVNFDHSGESVPAKDIQLTRALVLAAVLQADQILKIPEILNTSTIYSLDAELQNFIVNEWIKFQPENRFSERLLVKFQDISWIQENSLGNNTTPFPEEIL